MKKKAHKEIRYFLYVKWSRALKAKKVGIKCRNTGTIIYGFPTAILDYVRAKLPQNIKGEIRQDAYPVAMEEFCTAILPRKASKKSRA